MEKVETNDMKGWIIGAAVLVVVLIAGWWMIKHGKASSAVLGSDGRDTEQAEGKSPVQGSDTTLSSEATGKANLTATVAASGEAVSVKDQKAGASVTVDSMNLAHASWIAIRDTNRILGAAWFPVGTKTGTISLLRSTKAGETYKAVIYVDDGDKHFDMHKDTLVVGEDAGPVSASFGVK